MYYVSPRAFFSLPSGCVIMWYFLHNNFYTWLSLPTTYSDKYSTSSGFLFLKIYLDWLIKRSFTHGQAIYICALLGEKQRKIRSSLQDFLIYRHFPFYALTFFPAQVFPRVCLRDPIYDDLVLFQIIAVGGVRHREWLDRTNCLLFKALLISWLHLKLVSYSIGPFWFIFYLIPSACHWNRLWHLP